MRSEKFLPRVHSHWGGLGLILLQVGVLGGAALMGAYSGDGPLTLGFGILAAVIAALLGSIGGKGRSR